MLTMMTAGTEMITR